MVGHKTVFITSSFFNCNFKTYCAENINNKTIITKKIIEINENKSNIMENLFNKQETISNKNVLIVSTKNYKNVQNAINTINKCKKPNENFNFYVINEMYQEEKPKNIEIENYIFTKDSGDDQEIEKILNGIKKWNTNFDYNIQTDEFAVDLLGFINSELKLKGMQLEDCYKFRDKVVMKKMLVNKVKTPQLYSLKDIKNGKIKYPVILKPRCFAGSRGVEIIDNKSTLLKKLDGLYLDYSRVSGFNFGEEDVEVEEFIDAPICHIDGIVFDNEIKLCIASQYFNTCLDYTKGKILGSIKCSENQMEKANILAVNVNNCLHLPNGVFHMEAFWKDNEFIFLEIGIRPGGAEIVPTIEIATGINLSDEHIKCQLGIKPDKVNKKYEYFGWLNFPCKLNSNKKLYIKLISQIDFKNIKSLKLKNIPEINERVDVFFTNYSKNVGSFVFASDDKEELNKDMKFIAENYKVQFDKI